MIPCMVTYSYRTQHIVYSQFYFRDLETPIQSPIRATEGPTVSPARHEQECNLLTDPDDGWMNEWMNG